MILANKLKQAYNACMDKSAGIKPLKEIVAHIKSLIATKGARGGPRRLAAALSAGGPIQGLDDAIAFLMNIDVHALIKLDIAVSMPGSFQAVADPLTVQSK